MIHVQAVRFGVQWGDGRAVAAPLRIEMGELGEETTVDGMLMGHGWTMMRAEQLAHLVAGLMCAPGTVQIVGELLPPDSLMLQSTLHLFGYTVESC